MPVHCTASLTGSMQFARNNEICTLDGLFAVSSDVSLMWFCSEWTDSIL
jgi:hypothetical protein